jgi:hypothetical protein
VHALGRLLTTLAQRLRLMQRIPAARLEPLTELG